MREEKKMNPSLKKQSKGLWVGVYTGVAIIMVALVWGYNAYVGPETEVASNLEEVSGEIKPEKLVETNAELETLKYPFDEALLDRAKVLQDYYDMSTDEATRESSLLVFNQTYVTNSGVSIAIDGEPFEVLAAMTGKVEEVVADEFIGNEIVIKHPNGLMTKYRSVAEIRVKKGDTVKQGQPLGTATSNEWNPTAGVHLNFELLENGETINPREYLSF